MADFEEVLKQLKENKKKNQDELRDVKDTIAVGFDIVETIEERAEKREKDQKRVEAGHKANQTRMENLAKKQAEQAAAAAAAATKQNSFFNKISNFNKKQLSIAENNRKDAKADKLKKAEALREAKLGDKASAARNIVGKDIEEPSFLKKIFKLALGIFGAAVFIKLVQNFDQVKAFTTDKLIPALKSTFTFLKDTLTPVFEFIANNFKQVVTGVAVVAGAVIGARIIIRIINFIKAITSAFLTISSSVVSIYGNLLLVMKTLGGGLMKAVNFLAKITKPFRLFMMKTFIPNMIAMFKSMMGKAFSLLLGGISKLKLLVLAFKAFMLTTFLPAIGGFIMGLITSLGAVLIPLAIPIAIAAGIAAVVAGIGFALTKLRDALGFESIFDVLMLGVMHLKDAFATIVNFIGSIVNKILGIAEKFGKFIGFEVDLPEIPKMVTDSAEQFKAEAQKEGAGAKVLGEDGKFRGMDKEELARLEKREQEGKFITSREQRTLDAFQERRDRMLQPPQAAGGGNVANAVVNAPVSTTNVNNATTVMDAEPAIDGLDRFAMGGAF